MAYTSSGKYILVSPLEEYFLEWNPTPKKTALNWFEKSKHATIEEAIAAQDYLRRHGFESDPTHWRITNENYLPVFQFLN